MKTNTSFNAACAGLVLALLALTGWDVVSAPAPEFNREAVIPPQCYTKTEGRHNPCYVCHQAHDPAKGRVNVVNDAFLQGSYAFSDAGMSNHWSNLFKDRRLLIAAMSDAHIKEWIAADNYSSLASRRQGSAGYTPDLAHYADPARAFDEQGFARDGSGWVAFNYKPLPSTFWPTNGSTDDVLIRLPEKFRAQGGRHSREIYLLNLSVLEAAIKNLDSIDIPPADEVRLNVDLDGDGALSEHVVTLRRPARYLGDAADVAVTAHLYPQGTEFLHAVRYVGVNGEGGIVPSRRMKELRYMKKIRFLNHAQLASIYGNEYQEKLEGNLPSYPDFGAKGLDNGRGWQVLGFIEDAEGELRQQTYEEQLFCMGCHATTGTTVDHTFAFARKVEGARGWGYINLHGMPDAPTIASDEPEYLEYFRRVGGGDEFRQNGEMRERWFNADGSVNEAAVRAADVYTLTAPSVRRALDLDKAYYMIVREQSYTQGRDAVLAPAVNVYENVDASAPPLLPEHRVRDADIRLDWPRR